MTVHFTISLADVVTYLLIGAALYVPVNLLAATHCRPRARLGARLRRAGFVAFVVQVVAWPAALIGVVADEVRMRSSARRAS